MDYISTRGGETINPAAAILKGMADDGGLFVPSSFPILDGEDFDILSEMTYYERSAYILSKFLTDYSLEELTEYCRRAYSRFDGEAAPVIAADDDTYILELFHGPTLAFKDIALTLLPHLMSAARLKGGEKEKTLILVATSGDTGKAALEGFKDVSGTEIICFYPEGGVSNLQKLQMVTTSGGNVHVVGINGNFDDAQSAVKSLFRDKDAAKKLEAAGYKTSSANSINFGRLAPQIVYYISAYLDLLGSEEIVQGEKINFVVPTGNFGNILAAYYAKRMGLPIAKLIVASNKNDILTDFFNKGKYDANREFYKTISPSMDILISSNLERLLFELLDRDPVRINALMNDLKVYGSFEIDADLLKETLPEFVAYSSSEEDTKGTIENFFDMYGYLLDPHTAVGVSAYYDYISDTDDDTKTVIVSTASPYKFASDVYETISKRTEKDPFKTIKKLESYSGTDAPEAIKELANLPVKHNIVVPKEMIKDTVFAILNKETDNG